MCADTSNTALRVPQSAVKVANPRSIRLFVSSPFCDMQAEREVLVKRVFPHLRKLCEIRGVLWTDVDLRWGITDERKAENRVLPICLGQIDDCRPFFIGLLGERYGSALDEIDPGLLRLQPWLREHRGKSLTELEIMHGALNNPAAAEHTFFYFRNPAYTFGRASFDGTPTQEEIELWGLAEAERRASEARQKLASLKERLRASGLPVHEDYQDPQALGELVLRDLTFVIDLKYPKEDISQADDSEAGTHEAYATIRTRSYIGRTTYFQMLDAHVEGVGPPLVVIGEPGSGKSALLANWALAYRRSHLDRTVVMHFVGATADSSSKSAIMRRILSELARCPDLRIEIPDRPEALPSAFAQALQIVTEKRIVLIVDGLEQVTPDAFTEPMNSVNLWLPTDISPSFRLIFSGWFMGLEDRGWTTLEVLPLEVKERERLIVDYLARFGKELSPARVQQIANAEHTRNPLYLSALLGELRQHGDHLTLTRTVEHYLRARDLESLYKTIFARYEEDFELDRPQLVRDALSLIWAARLGLAEVELRDLLSRNGDPLPMANWLQLYFAGEQLFVIRSGLIGFAHDHIRRAVEDRYVPGEEARRAVHHQLADYFDSRDLSFRKIAELPTQLAKANDWARLYVLMSDDLEFRAAIMRTDKFEWPSYVTHLMEVLQTKLSPTLFGGEKLTSKLRLPTEQQWGVCQGIIQLRRGSRTLPGAGPDCSVESTVSPDDKIRYIERFRRDIATLLFHTVLTPDQQAEFHRTFNSKMQDEGFRKSFRDAFRVPALDHAPARRIDAGIVAPWSSGLASVAHPSANPDRASNLNRQYIQDLQRWHALPWWKRLRVKKPERPTGI
jgi:hypothetical protein